MSGRVLVLLCSLGLGIMMIHAVVWIAVMITDTAAVLSGCYP